ncbi:hypothetical protein F2P79_020883 [Pimephales promelas]|nr:hypothetical protein F2P79_020883 [Pimephales promelas]
MDSQVLQRLITYKNSPLDASCPGPLPNISSDCLYTLVQSGDLPPPVRVPTRPLVLSNSLDPLVPLVSSCSSPLHHRLLTV